MSVDHESHGAVVPIIALDLTTDSGVTILWQMLESANVLAVHMGLPCGTASLAREKPVAPHLQALGVPNPPPLRSAQFPLGLPNLGAYHQAKVDSANTLYQLAIEVLVYCHQRNIVVSIENPARSWLWAALVKLTVEHSPEAAKALNALERVEFHACCHGSTRRKFVLARHTRSFHAPCRDLPKRPCTRTMGSQMDSSGVVFRHLIRSGLPHIAMSTRDSLSPSSCSGQTIFSAETTAFAR